MENGCLIGQGLGGDIGGGIVSENEYDNFILKWDLKLGPNRNSGVIYHVLNGEKVVEFEPWSDDWNKRRNSGKWNEYLGYGRAKKGK